jgi:RNA polymerase sigma factor (sigma-70 family)
MKEQKLIPHLFRTEFSKITVILCKLFGLEHMEIAEDITSETFAAALENWPHNGIPDNPTAWLYAVAKNKTRNYLKRNNIFREKIAGQIRYSTPENNELDIDLSDNNISDSQLQMLFAICHPSISTEAQIGLALRILCGFGIDEIATAFLTGKETIYKRLYRAKKKLREEQVQIEFPAVSEINNRLETVLTTLYLLFNEGYYSESNEKVFRKDLCLEAMRLTYLLINNGQTNTPDAYALLALMCFHASRFDAREDDHGEMVLYYNQDRSLWNEELVSRGVYFFKQASQGDHISSYHLEAGIAWWYTVKTDTKEKWENILQLYNRLLTIKYSPVAALNRTYALSKVHGTEAAIKEAEKLNLTDNHYYFTLLGELYKDIGDKRAKQYLQKAFSLARTQSDKKTIRGKIDNL